jgi:hypothetical protein
MMQGVTVPPNKALQTDKVKQSRLFFLRKSRASLALPLSLVVEAVEKPLLASVIGA